MNSAMRKLVARLLIVSITGLAFPGFSQAENISTEAAVAGAGRERIASYLDRHDVRVQLEARGVNPAEVKLRVAALTDAEAAKLAGEMDSLPAGGFIEALLTVFLVLLLTDILGLTKVFPFTKPIR